MKHQYFVTFKVDVSSEDLEDFQLDDGSVDEADLLTWFVFRFLESPEDHADKVQLDSWLEI